MTFPRIDHIKIRGIKVVAAILIFLIFVVLFNLYFNDPKYIDQCEIDRRNIIRIQNDAYAYRIRYFRDKIKRKRDIEERDYRREYNLLSKKLKDKKDDPELLYLRGKLSFCNDKYDFAVKDFEKAIGLKPETFMAYYYIGKIYLEKNNIEKALEYFNKGLQINSEFSLFYIEKGNCYFAKRHLTKADNEYDNAYKFMNSNEERIEYNLCKGDVYYKKYCRNGWSDKEPLDKAIKCLSNIYELDNNNPESYRRYAIFLTDSPFEVQTSNQIERCIRTQISIAPYDSTSYSLYGFITGKRIEIDKSLIIDNNLFIPYYWKGMIEYSNKNYEKAINYFNQAENIMKKRYSKVTILLNLDSTLYTIRGECYKRLGKLDLAEKDFKDAERIESLEKDE